MRLSWASRDIKAGPLKEKKRRYSRDQEERQWKRGESRKEGREEALLPKAGVKSLRCGQTLTVSSVCMCKSVCVNYVQYTCVCEYVVFVCVCVRVCVWSMYDMSVCECIVSECVCLCKNVCVVCKSVWGCKTSVWKCIRMCKGSSVWVYMSVLCVRACGCVEVWV